MRIDALLERDEVRTGPLSRPAALRRRNDPDRNWGLHE